MQKQKDPACEFRGHVGVPGLAQHHAGNLLGLERLPLALVIDLNDGRSSRPTDDRERPMLHIALDAGIAELPPNEPLGIEDGIMGVHRGLGLGGIADQAFGFREGDVGGGGAVALIVGDDLDAVVLPHADARVSGSEVDTDAFSVNCCWMMIKEWR